MKYRGFSIQSDEFGYFASKHGEEFGYCDTPEEIKAEINDYLADTRTDENVYGLASIAQSVAEDTFR